jgi:hypothetical protein
VLGAIQLTMRRVKESPQQAALINRSRNPTFGNDQVYNNRFYLGKTFLSSSSSRQHSLSA